MPGLGRKFCMSIWLEDKIREAVLTLRWRRAGEGLHPGYFVEVPRESLQLEDSAASFLARFIAQRVAARQDASEPDPVRESLDKYSLDVIASYLEDQGYTVNSPG